MPGNQSIGHVSDDVRFALLTITYSYSVLYFKDLFKRLLNLLYICSIWIIYKLFSFTCKHRQTQRMKGFKTERKHVVSIESHQVSVLKSPGGLKKSFVFISGNVLDSYHNPFGVTQ
jgi:Ca2+/Na+ antiporter